MTMTEPGKYGYTVMNKDKCRDIGEDVRAALHDGDCLVGWIEMRKIEPNARKAICQCFQICGTATGKRGAVELDGKVPFVRHRENPQQILLPPLHPGRLQFMKLQALEQPRVEKRQISVFVV